MCVGWNALWEEGVEHVCLGLSQQILLECVHAGWSRRQGIVVMRSIAGIGEVSGGLMS